MKMAGQSRLVTCIAELYIVGKKGLRVESLRVRSIWILSRTTQLSSRLSSVFAYQYGPMPRREDFLRWLDLHYSRSGVHTPLGEVNRRNGHAIRSATLADNCFWQVYFSVRECNRFVSCAFFSFCCEIYRNLHLTIYAWQRCSSFDVINSLKNKKKIF